MISAVIKLLIHLAIDRTQSCVTYFPHHYFYNDYYFIFPAPLWKRKHKESFLFACLFAVSSSKYAFPLKTNNPTTLGILSLITSSKHTSLIIP